MGRIEIRDAKKTVNGKKINVFRVRTVGENNEILQVSEVLNSVEAVKTHIRAMAVVWGCDGEVNVLDCTYRGKFEGKEISLEKYDKLKFETIS